MKSKSKAANGSNGVEQLRAKLIPISKLKPHPRNYRNHPAEQVEQIKESIRRSGLFRNVVIAKDGTILAGHGVVEACRGLGMKNLMAVTLPIESESKAALAVLAGDNELSRMGTVDDRLLSQILTEVRESEIGLLGTGYSDAALESLIGRLGNQPPTDFPEVSEGVNVEFQCPKCSYRWSGKPS